jgi:hypothetical protein
MADTQQDLAVSARQLGLYHKGAKGIFQAQESGKGLSTNDYTTADKNKLASIADGAEVNQNAFVKAKVGSTTITASGKQDVLTYAAGDNVTITPDSTNKQIKIAAKDTTYNAATTSAAGLMSADDKAKLDGVASGANNYTLPTASGSTLGGVKSGSDVTSTSGLTPAPINDGVPYYKDTNTTYSAVTTSANGLMTAADKKKLDAFGVASTYATQTFVVDQIAASGHIKKTIVDTLPDVSAADANTIYMVKKSAAQTSNGYNEYMVVSGAWELIGDTDTTLEFASDADIQAILDS